MKRFPQIVLLAFMTLVIVSLAAALGLWLFVPREKVAALITSELSGRLNQEIAVDSFSVGFYPDLEFVTRNVRIVDPPTSRELLSAQNVRFDLNLRALLNRKFVVEDIAIGSPRLDLIRSASGAWNIENLMRGMRSPEKKDETTPPVNLFGLGRIIIRNGSISIRDESSGQQIEVKNLSATLNLREETLRIDKASVTVPPLEGELSGTVSQLFKPTPLLDISTTLAIKKEGPLAARQAIAVPPGKKIADISLEASGDIERLRLRATFSLNPLVTADLSARGSIAGMLTVEEGLFTVDTLTAHIGKSTLALSGTLKDIWLEERSARLKGTTALSLREAVAFAKTDALAGLKLRGSASAAITLDASAEQAGLTATIDLDRAGFSLPRVMDKKIGAPGRLILDARYTYGDELVVDTFDFSMGREAITGSLEVQPGRDPRLKASFSASDFPLGHLNRLPAVTFEEGTLALSAQVWQSDEGLRFNADAGIDNATLAVRRMNQPFQNLDLRIHADHTKATLQAPSFFFGESHCRLDAEVTDFNTPRISGHLNTDLLDINKIIAAFTRQGEVSEKKPPSPETPPPQFSLDLNVRADALHFGRVKTGAVSAAWQTSGLVQKFDPFHIKAFGGTLEGMFELAVLRDGVCWDADFSGQDIILEELTDQLFAEREKLKGIISAQGTLKGGADADPEAVWRSINGELDYTANSVQFKESPLFKAMLLATRASGMLIPGLQQVSLANLLIDTLKSGSRTFHLNQLYFDTVDGSVDINDGLVRTDDSFFAGDAVNLLFQGDIDMPKENYNLRTRATPIGTIGSLVHKVPLIGKQIERIRNATLSLNFSVTGPFSDPTVQLTAVERLTPKDEEQSGEGESIIENTGRAVNRQ